MGLGIARAARRRLMRESGGHMENGVAWMAFLVSIGHMFRTLDAIASDDRVADVVRAEARSAARRGIWAADECLGAEDPNFRVQLRKHFPQHFLTHPENQ